MFRPLSRLQTKPPLATTPTKCLRTQVLPGTPRRQLHITSGTQAKATEAPNPPGPRPWSGKGSGKCDRPGHGCNPLEDPANDLGGPGGQELYPASMAFQKRYASITAVGVMISGALMYMAKRMQRAIDPNVRYVLVRDMSKGEIDDVKMIPVRVPLQEAGR